MFCNQCEQASHGVGCIKKSVCGKSEVVSDLFDLVLLQTKGMSWLRDAASKKGKRDPSIDRHIIQSLFLTVTNVNFDETRVLSWIRSGDKIMDQVAELAEYNRNSEGAPEAVSLALGGMNDQELISKSRHFSIQRPDKDQDLNSLTQLLTYGLKGLAAYAEHAVVLGESDQEIFDFVASTLSAILINDLTMDELVTLNMKCGEVNIRCMELLNQAHIKHFGKPVATPVSSGTKKGPAIVVSGHDLFMLEQLLKQCDKAGVNVYTHGEMLPAHGYPKLCAHKSLVGHFGTAWQNQQNEFDRQPAAFLFNTNCIQKPKDSYSDRVYTTGLVGWPGVTHIEGYDFSSVIEKAKSLGGFEDDPGFTLMTGFGHDTILDSANEIVNAVKEGAIKHFFLVGGCDGAKPGRNYFTDFVEQSPEDTVTLTLACGKFRFNHLQESMGVINGIPRLLDVGQCNDAYSAVRVATALAEAFDCGVNDLPLSMIISWYEQKAVAVLLSLLHLGVKGIRLGPSLPAFVTPGVLDFLSEHFDIKPIGNSAKADLEEILTTT